MNNEYVLQIGILLFFHILLIINNTSLVFKDTNIVKLIISHNKFQEDDALINKQLNFNYVLK